MNLNTNNREQKSNLMFQDIYSIPEFEFLEDIKYIIYSGGKTGSSTLMVSLKNSLHVHADIDLWHRYPITKEYGITIKNVIEYLYEKRDKQVFVISAYREPITRAISSFFEENYNSTSTTLNLDDSIALFNDVSFLIREEYNPMFDENTLFDLDIKQMSFDKKKGYQLYQNDKIKLLVLRFDIIDQWETIISQHLDEEDRKDFNFLPSNLSETKWYAKIYENFKKNFKTTRYLLDEKFRNNIETLNYFYSPLDIANLIFKWYSYCIPSDQHYIRVPNDFNWNNYLEINSDLSGHFTTEYQAKRHWILHGNKENRKY